MGTTALGKVVVTTAGTPVRLTTDTTIEGNTITFQSWPANTGKIYIGTSTLNKTTGVGLLYVIPGATESFAIGGGDYLNAFRASDYYIDAEVSGESAIVSVYVR